MDIAHLTQDQYIKQAWKNGGGTTTEIVRQVVDGETLFRISIATVAQSGPFSDFSGFDRIIMLLNGNGMTLSFDQSAGQPQDQRLDLPRVPFAFAGDWNTDSQLIDGPVEDFNLMVDRQRARGQLQVHELTASTLTCRLRGDTEVWYCLRGRAEIESGGQHWALETGETLRIDVAGYPRGERGGESMMLRAITLPCSLAEVCIERLRRE